MGRIKKYSLAFSILFLSACSHELIEVDHSSEDTLKPIHLAGNIDQEYVTKVSDGGFADKDEIGVYIVDYNGSTPGELANSGNRADNLKFIYDEPNNRWSPLHDVYWKNNFTHVDIFGYYPYDKIDDVNGYGFEVKLDQNADEASSSMSGFEASDFLWGKAEDVAPTDAAVVLQMRHILASVRVTLIEGSGFGAGEWDSASKSVLVSSTRRSALINLNDGSVSVTGDVGAKGIIAARDRGDFRAIVIPQTVSAGSELINVTINGSAYPLIKSESMTYSQSKQHNFSIVVNKKADGAYSIELGDESITRWENDLVTHEASAKEYLIVDVKEHGTLEETLKMMGADPSGIVNIKLLGSISHDDIRFMNEQMTRLSGLNMKNVRVENDVIPDRAFSRNYSLSRLILPDKVKIIGLEAFAECSRLMGSLILPEGLEVIESAAFLGCTSLTGELKLPSTLHRIGQESGYREYYDGAFGFCNFTGELLLPEKLDTIGIGTFYECKNFVGELHLPENLKAIGTGAFEGCIGMSGNLEIPQGITKLNWQVFSRAGFNGNLILHEGLRTIGNSAFNMTPLKGELNLPNSVSMIGEAAFYGCDFSGGLRLPSRLMLIGHLAFAGNWRITGIVEIPSGITSIGSQAFMGLRSLEGIILPEDLEVIGDSAFEGCVYMNSITCKGELPPRTYEYTFSGVPKDNFTVNVPEGCVSAYVNSQYWKDFKRISDSGNLLCRPRTASALNSAATRTLVLNADGDWIVEYLPSWCHLDATSGHGKTELVLTIDEMPRGEDRTDEIVFTEPGGARTRCTVTQCDYEHEEDEIINLHRAVKGNGVPVVFLGEGYNAQDIQEGKLLNDVNEAYHHFFDIEPYKSYIDYFDVNTAISLSAESGIGSVNTIIYNRFNTTAKGGVTLSGRNGDADFDDIFEYCTDRFGISDVNRLLVVIVANTTDYGGITYMWYGGAAIAYCPLSDYGYPYDFRGVIQHEAGGHGFGKLGDEYIYHNAFIDACGCSCCGHEDDISKAKAVGWYPNLSLSGKMTSVNWSHLIFHERYSQIVDIFEGGFMHNRGVFRSEANSCMNNDIPYYSTVSREAIVKRIMELAGEEYSFEDFVANDVIDYDVQTKSAVPSSYSSAGRPSHNLPVIVK